MPTHACTSHTLTHAHACMHTNVYLTCLSVPFSLPRHPCQVITATPRQLESLIRISEALARLKLASTVTHEDVTEARRLLDVAMQQSATDPTTGTIDMDLITTGVSASERAKRVQLQEALLSFLQDRATASRSSFRAPQVRGRSESI
ncbi:unnamed protein product [Closterium sp. NIES-53]